MLPHTGLSWLMKVALQIRIRGLVDLLGFQPNLPAVSLLCISLYTEITGLSFDKGRLKPLFQTALTFYASRGFLRLR